jgi:predicted O-linked N-acetylglucosamine transferase (SPINDLY family)
MTSQPPTASHSTIEIAIQHHRAGRLAEAEDTYRQILDTHPEHFDALHLLGVIAYQAGRHAEAVRLISKAIEQDSSAFPAFNNLGLVHRALHNMEEARGCFQQALSLNPDYVDAHNNLADLFQMQGNLEAAASELQKVLAVKPDLVNAHFNLGSVLRQQGKLSEAIACYRNALSLNPAFAEAHFGLANALEVQGIRAAALAEYQEALRFKPDLAEAHFRLGSMLQDQGMLDEAIACFNTSLALKPDYVEARWNLAMSQLTLAYGPGEDPKTFRVRFSRALAELDAWFDGNRIKDGYKAVGSQQPFYLAYQECDNLDLLSQYGNLCARLMKNWQDEHGRVECAAAKDLSGHGVVRVGIVSAYIRDHSVWTAIVKGWCDQLDRDRFEIHIFCPGNVYDDETAFARSRSAYFLHGTKDLSQWADAVVGQRLDVIIYPEIGMDPMTLKLASMRMVPIQVAAWGHPETTGLPTIDYYVSAEDFEPANAQNHYRERLVRLPHLGCRYQPLRVEPVDVDLEARLGDPGSPLLLCAGTPYKYDPDHDRVLIEIARGLKRCQFLFFHDPNENLSAKLQERLDFSFAQAGLNFADYGVFLPRQTRAAFYGILRRADVDLDTIGFSGFNTAMQAIECGLPIVTIEGRFMRGRFASGILKRMGLPELVAPTRERYVELAIRLAQDADYRRDVRARIAASRSVLFDDVAPLRALEDFLLEVTARSGKALAS